MKKSSFVSLILGTASIMMFGIGMCMVLIPEWDAFRPGLVFGGVGILLGIITILVWRKMEGKTPIRLSAKTMGSIAVGILGALLLGVGMCFCMVWNKMILGILIGMAGILTLLCLIPLTKGFKE